MGKKAFDAASFEQHIDDFIGGDGAVVTRAQKSHLNDCVARINAIGDWADEQAKKKQGGAAVTGEALVVALHIDGIRHTITVLTIGDPEAVSEVTE